MATPEQPSVPRIVPSHRVRLSRELIPVGAPAHDHANEPQIILIRDGDTVKAIEVICTCGQRIRMNCVF